MTKWAKFVPDVENKEKDFHAFAKKGIEKGGQLFHTVEKWVKKSDTTCAEWQCALTLEMDKVIAPAQEELNDMKALSATYALFCLVRNPQIKSTQGATLRAAVGDVRRR